MRTLDKMISKGFQELILCGSVTSVFINWLYIYDLMRLVIF